jgi:hypothetical protein
LKLKTANYPDRDWREKLHLYTLQSVQIFLYFRHFSWNERTFFCCLSRHFLFGPFSRLTLEMLNYISFVLFKVHALDCLKILVHKKSTSSSVECLSSIILACQQKYWRNLHNSVPSVASLPWWCLKTFLSLTKTCRYNFILVNKTISFWLAITIEKFWKEPASLSLAARHLPDTNECTLNFLPSFLFFALFSSFLCVTNF